MTDLATRPHDQRTGHDGHPDSRPDNFVDTHPTFCANADDPFAGCGTHLAQPVVIPATAGTPRPVDGGVLYHSITVAAAVTEDQLPAVHVEVSNPTGALLRPSEARRLAALLTAAALDAEASA